MISMDEARQRVDRRLEVLYEETFEITDVGLVCSGTDVLGPELADEVQKACIETMRWIGRGDKPGSTVNGMLVRMFWLGYEHGREAD